MRTDETRSRRRRRWVAAILVVLVASGLGTWFYARSRLDDWVRIELENRLAELTGGEASVGALHVEPLGPACVFTALRLKTESDPGGALELRIRQGRINLAWSSLAGLVGGRIHLDRLRLEGLEVTTDQEVLTRRRKVEGDGNFDLRIDDLEIVDSRWFHEDWSRPLELELSNLSVQGRDDPRKRALVGELAVDFRVLSKPLAQPLDLKIGTDFRLFEDRVEFDELRALGAGAEVELGGAVSWESGFELDAEGWTRTDLDQVGQRLEDQFPPIAGVLSGPIRVTAGADPLVVEGRVTVEPARYGDIRAISATSRVRYTPGHLSLRELVAGAYGGRVEGRVDVELVEPVAFRASLRGERLDSVPLLEWIRLPLPFDSRLDAVVSLEGIADARESWSGEGSFLAREKEGDGIPLAGSGKLILAEGRLEIEGEDLTAAAAQMGLSLSLDLASEPITGELDLVGRTLDAAETHEGTLRILGNLGVDSGDLVRTPVAGFGELATRVGFGGKADLDFRTRLENGHWGDQSFDSASVDLSLRGEMLELREVALRKGEEQLAGSGQIDLVSGLPSALELQAKDLRVEPLLMLLGLGSVEVSGVLDGAVSLAEERGAMSGSGRLRLSEGRLFGERFAEAHADLAVQDGNLILEPVSIAGPAIAGRGKVSFRPEDQVLRVELVNVAVELSELELLKTSDLALDGHVAARGALEVDGAGALGGSLILEADSWQLANVPLGQFGGEATLDGEGVDLKLHGEDVGHWTLDGRVGWSDGFPVAAEVGLDDLLVEPLDGAEQAIWGRLSGRGRVEGQLADPATLEIEGMLTEASATFGARKLTLDQPIPVELVQGRARLSPSVWTGKETRFEAELAYDIFEDRLESEIRGNLDLGLISGFYPDVRASGQVDVGLRAVGPLDGPDLSGQVTLARGRLRWLPFPQSLDQLQVKLSLKGDRVDIEAFRGVLGGGDLEGSGSVRLGRGGEVAPSCKLDASGVRIGWPEGFEGVYDARLHLEGNLEELALSGSIEMLQGIYNKNFVFGGLFGGGREYSSEASWDFPGEISLDLDLVAEDNVWVRNDMAKVESRLDLNIGGTAAKPELIGRVTLLEGGTLVYRKVEYDLESGSLDFIDLDRINPDVLMQAVTRVGSYEVRLRVDGTLDKFEYELSSDPSLAQQDIIALLTTGRTLESLSGSGAEFTGDLAANYFAGALTQKFEKQMQRLLGLERVQIDPLLVEDESDPTTRITLGEKVSDDLFVIVSTDVGSTQRELYQIEWQATEKLQVTIQHETETGIGGDIRFTDRYWWKRPEAHVETAVLFQSPDGGPTSMARIGSVKILGVDPERAEALLRRLPFAVGDDFRRSRVFGGSSQIRRFYVRRGQIQADVESQVTPDPDDGESMHVSYTVEPGPTLEVELLGVKKKHRKRLRSRLQQLWSESVFTDDLYDDSSALIRSYFQDLGFYTADVFHTLVEADSADIALRFEIDTGKSVRVERVEIEGASDVDQARIRRQMLTRPGSLFSRNVLKPKVLSEDLGAIRNLYRDQGHLRVKIEEPEVRLSSQGDSAVVTLKIDEGPQFRIDRVVFPQDGPVEASRLAEWSGFPSGTVYSPARLLEAESGIRAGLDAMGYPAARVQSRVELRDPSAADVTYLVDPGAKMRVGRIEIQGNSLTREVVIRRELELEVGDLVSREKLLKSQHQLYRLGIFRSVRVSHAPMVGESETEQVLRVEVDESPPLIMGIGAGYDSEGGARLSASTTNTNLLGTDLEVGLQGYYSDILTRFQIFAKRPRLFNRKLPTLVNFSVEERDETGFEVKRRTMAVRLDKRLNLRWQANTRYSFQRVDLFNVENALAVQEEKLEDLRLGDIGVTFVRDTRDDPILTRGGTYLSINSRLFAEPLFSDSNFIKTTLKGTWIHSWSNDTTFASSVRLGVADPFGSTDGVPLSERYFAGGDSTLRGFPRDEVGPQEAGQPTGGESLLLFNNEYRIPLWGQFRGVVFYDAGNVYRTVSDFDPSDLRHVLGLGLRLETPIGPFRLEYGRKVDREPGESRGELFLAIGAAF